MSEPISTIEDILNVLPAVQKAVRQEIQTRINAKERIVGKSAAREAKKPIEASTKTPLARKRFAAAKRLANATSPQTGRV